MISFAQNNEDVVLNRVFGGMSDGFYIDVGAADPTIGSITKHFSDLGWHGINVEPVRHYFDKLMAQRPHDVNLSVALSNQSGWRSFYEAPADYGVSGFSTELMAQHRARGIPFVERKVQVLTLAEVCSAYAPETIDLLCIDVEGHEREVIEGNDWQRWRPRVLVIEAVGPVSGHPTHEEWEPTLLSAGYLPALFDGLNRFYVRSEDADLAPAISAPASVLDGFVRSAEADELVAARAMVHGLQSQLVAVWAELDRIRESRGDSPQDDQPDPTDVRFAPPPDDPGRSGDVPFLAPPSVGPTALRLAQRLTDLAVRHPRAWATTRTLLRSVRRILR